MASSRAKKQGLARRYPALLFLLAAGALAILLPSALNVPQSGPTTLAEFAPVPGQGDGRSDVSDLGSAVSGGIGFGSGSGGKLAPPPSSVGKPDQASRRLKRCVGQPPRQTEDPLSPPCVAFFDGDNFGSTARGVTRDQASVLARMTNTDPATDRDAGRVFSCADLPSTNDQFQDVLCKAYWRYFNDRYQTYGRLVQLWSIHNPYAAANLDQQYKPFAAVDIGQSGNWAPRKILSVSYVGSSRSSYLKDAPHVVSFRADSEDQSAMAASFVCGKLAGRRAQFAGDDTLAGRQRKFGFLYAAPGHTPRKEAMRAYFRDNCGFDVTEETSDWQTQQGMVKLRGADVTSVILLVDNIATATNYATQLAYFPEWIIVGATDSNGIDNNFQARTANPVQWANSFGVTYDYRRDALKTQAWYRAYREGCSTPECPEPAAGMRGVQFGAAIYDSMNMLFYGIQAAGPRLTAENIDKGLHAIPARGSDDPYRPAAYFAPGNYSFIKDAMAIWWDPTGQPPDSQSRGCYRLPHEGRRFRPAEWIGGDDDIQMQGPCQADTFVG